MGIAAIFLAVSLIIIMFGMGLSLTKNDFIRIVQYPKAITIGLINQILILPLIAYVICIILNLKSEIALGIMILAACPGGPTSNLITYVAKGDSGLSVSLTVVNSFITIFTIPFIIDFALSQFLNMSEIIQINKIQTIIQIAIIIVIPTSIGMIIKNKKPVFASKMNKPVKIASLLVLILVIIGLVIQKKSDLIPYLQLAGISTLILNITTMLIGFITAKILKLNLAQSLTISIETGIQNGTMAIAIASGILLNDNFAIAPAVYSLIMFLTGGIIIGIGLNLAHKKTL